MVNHNMACTKVTFFALFVTICAFNTVQGQKTVVELNEETWREMLKGEWLVEFYAPWCPACKALERKWREFAQLGPGLGIKVGAIDVTTAPGLSGRFMVTALPTIFHVIDGEFRQYKGSRDSETFMTYIEEKKWEKVDPIPSWKSPDTIQMSIISSFFKVSQQLRQIHNKLMEEYGLPTFGSYLIFAAATIVIGAVIGLVLVCVIDLIYPPKGLGVISSDKKKQKHSDDELDDADIRDDLIDDVSQSGGEGNSGGSDSESQASSNSNNKTTKRRKTRRLDM